MTIIGCDEILKRCYKLDSQCDLFISPDMLSYTVNAKLRINARHTVLFSDSSMLAHKRDKHSEELSPCLCCYGVSGSLHVGLAVNISGLLYMVCCRCRSIHRLE